MGRFLGAELDHRLRQQPAGRCSREVLGRSGTRRACARRKTAPRWSAQSYNVFRYIMACQSRGRIQAKFNGGLFTQQLHLGQARAGRAPARQKDGTWLTHEDDRLWGRRFTYPEPAVALLAALGQRRLRSDAAVLRLLLPAADAQGDYQGLVRARRRVLSREHRAHRGRAGLRSWRPAAQDQAGRERMPAGITITTSPPAWKLWR